MAKIIPDEELDPSLYLVARKKHTEPPFTGRYLYVNRKGSYNCAICGTKLFASDAKFGSGSGWSSFSEPANLENISLSKDDSHGMQRTEVSCKKCGAHLGHLFDDGPMQRGGKRYCINSICLEFSED